MTDEPTVVPFRVYRDRRLMVDLRDWPNPLSRRLSADVLQVGYDAAERIGRVWLAAGSCVDMTSAIDLFLQLDPEVVLIETFAGEDKDTSYRRDGPSTWTAVDPAGGQWSPVEWPAPPSA